MKHKLRKRARDAAKWDHPTHYIVTVDCTNAEGYGVSRVVDVYVPTPKGHTGKDLHDEAGQLAKDMFPDESPVVTRVIYV